MLDQLSAQRHLIAQGLLLAQTTTSTGTTPAFVSGLQATLSTAGTWITGLALAGGGTMVGYHALMRNLNDDPQHVAHHTGAMKKVVVGSAIVAAASSIGHFASGLLM